jgi:hypothetical protein
MTTYKLTRNPNMVLKDGELFIPFDPANSDYQDYLKWLEEGNTPEPADETTQGAA